MNKDSLQIIDTRTGTGKAVVKGALITTQYTGTLEDGTVFDSSWERGKPFQCVIGTWHMASGRWARTSSPTATCALRSSCWKC